MSNYVSVVRRRRRNLLIVEGNHEKNKLFSLMFQCFPEINIDIKDVCIIFIKRIGFKMDKLI